MFNDNDVASGSPSTTHRPATAASPGVDADVFRHVVGHFATGVTVLTTVAEGRPYGTTASAVSSLSLQPPMMLVCLNRASATHDAIARSRRFAVNILSESQDPLAWHFSRKIDDKFATVDHVLSAAGLPLLSHTLATIECLVDETASGGTHTVFLGRVIAADAVAGAPLAYFRGKFGRFIRTHEALSYDGVREWVLRRRTPLGTPLRVDEIAQELHSDALLVHNSLVKLSAESLVHINESGEFAPSPITGDLSDSLYEARATIETGVLEAHVPSVTDRDAADLQELARRVDTARQRHTLDDFLASSAAFHLRVVGLAGSTELSESFRRLGIGTVWRRALDEREWREWLATEYIGRIADAVADRDASAAKTAVRDSTDQVKRLSRLAIERHGGAV